MTKQEVFDQVVAHLRKQGVRALNEEGRCRYRHGSLSCAIGCLIKEEEYSPSLESRGINEIFGEVPTLNERLRDVSITLLCALQWVHDNSPPENWEYKFAVIAANYGLQLKAKE